LFICTILFLFFRRLRPIQTLRINPFQEFKRVQTIWTSLEAQAPTSFFNSWGWVSSWLHSLPSTTAIELIVNVDGDTPLCCFFLGTTHQRENKFKKKRGFLNNTGIECYDDLVIEYNSILCLNNDIEHQLNIALSALKSIEEFRFSHTHNINFNKIDDFIQRDQFSPSYWVDLKAIDNQINYLSLLSKNKRNQIKRSIKAYELGGELQVEFASDINQANSFFIKLEELHQKEWIKRGKPGAFSEPFFKKFHQTLISSLFEQGAIQLIRIYNDEADIGYIYNFVHNNEVLFYQCGFEYKTDNKYRPGLVSHYLTISKCIELNFDKYNFLAGETPYKQSLSTHSDTLQSAVLSRKTIKSRIEQSLRTIKATF